MDRTILAGAVLAAAGCGQEAELLCQFERPSIFRIAHADGSFSEGPFDCAYRELEIAGDGVDVKVQFSAVTSHALLELIVSAPSRTWSVSDGALGGADSAVSVRLFDLRFMPDRVAAEPRSTSGTVTLDAERWPVEEGERGRIVADLQGELDDGSTLDAALRFELLVVPKTLRTGRIGE